ncbi:MAG: envelope stress response membrane protein PspB [Rhodobacterales bacterium]|nr:envelope stress response membrane protein PspB [Rhodobacterales bacterium]
MPTFIETPLIIFLAVVAPIWIIAHYMTRWRTSKTLTVDDEKMLAELWEIAPKLESRINTLEAILDDEVPDWRKKI